ncbi:DUF982 domain-containing protein [Neorhizobium petrolearium]|uniref:DUF982 domain-containing protein n=1 Tax=Neorhizobium petrolearium TaxID=515361 RepID=UPI00398AE7F9
MESGTNGSNFNLIGWRSSNVTSSIKRVFRPLRFDREGNGCIFIGSVEDAIEFVADSWPVRAGEAYENALQACIDGINDRISPNAVRQILYSSATAAGLHVSE